jgi:hypothetical protein
MPSVEPRPASGIRQAGIAVEAKAGANTQPGRDAWRERRECQHAAAHELLLCELIAALCAGLRTSIFDRVIGFAGCELAAQARADAHLVHRQGMRWM